MRTFGQCCMLMLVVLVGTNSTARAQTLKLWHNNRITPEQPFPARVVGVLPSWIGYELLLEEITDKKQVLVGYQGLFQGPRLCIARLTKTEDLEYTLVSNWGSLGADHEFHKVTLLRPGVPVNDFSWSIGAYTIGRRFGEEDFVAQQYPRWTRRGSDQEPVPQTQSEDDNEVVEFLARKQQQPKPDLHLRAHTGNYSWQLGPDRQHYIVWRNADGTIEVWDLSKDKATHTFKFDRYIWGVTLNEGATHFVTYSVSRQGEDDPIAHLWDVNKEAPIREFKADFYNRNRVFSDGAISHDGRLCLENSCAGADSAPFITTFTLWDTSRSPPQRRSSLTIDDRDPLLVSHLHFGDETARLVANCGLSERVYVCDMSQKEPALVYNEYGSEKAPLLAVNEDVTKFLSWHARDRGGDLQLRTITRKKPLRVISTKQSIAGAEFSQDGARFIAWNDRRTVSLWDAQTGKLIRKFRADPDVRGALFNQDETCIASWTASNTVQLWDTERGTLLDRFTHTSAVRGAAFHPSKTLVVAWDAGGDIRLWKPGSPKPLASFHHAHPLPYIDSKQVSFDREGKRVISTDSSQSELMLWQIPEEDARKE